MPGSDYMTDMGLNMNVVLCKIKEQGCGICEVRDENRG